MAQQDLKDEHGLLTGAGWFGSLSAPMQQEMLAHSAVWRVAGRRVLLSQGATTDVWFGIAAGAVRLSHGLADGRERVVGLLQTGDWFGDVPLLTGAALPYTAQTLVDCTLLLMRRPRLRELMAGHPELPEALARLNWESAVRSMERAVEESTATLEERTLELLTRLSLALDFEPGKPLHQSELAALLGASRQRLNEALKRLERTGRLAACRESIAKFRVL